MRKTPSILVGIVLLLLALGIVMLASASSVKGTDAHTDAQYFLKRQLAWMAVSLLLSALAAGVNYRRWQEFWIPLAILSATLLVLVLVPHVGAKIGGSRRWLRIGPVSFQPSELAKFGTVVMLAAWMSRVGRKAGQLLEGVAKPGLALAVISGLIFFEPDFGTTILVATVGLALLYAGGANPRVLLVVSVLGFAGFAVAVLHDPVRMGRVLAFLMPEKYPAAAYQMHQSMDAFTIGGVGGLGLGKSIQKHYFLPEAHTDFIQAIVGEELGLTASCLVVLLFGGFLACGMRISLQAPDLFGRLLGTGLTLMTTVQAAINVGVVTGCLPTKGLPLPFISYGGSSLMMSLVSVGVLLNIARHGVADDAAPHHAVKDRARWF